FGVLLRRAGRVAVDVDDGRLGHDVSAVVVGDRLRGEPHGGCDGSIARVLVERRGGDVRRMPGGVVVVDGGDVVGWPPDGRGSHGGALRVERRRGRVARAGSGSRGNAWSTGSGAGKDADAAGWSAGNSPGAGAVCSGRDTGSVGRNAGPRGP